MWLFVVLIVLFVGLFAVMQVFTRQIMDFTGTRSPFILPDTHFYYTSIQLISILDSFGPSDRLSYLHLHLVDMFFPLVYGLLLALSMICLWGKLGGDERKTSLLNRAEVTFPMF